MFSLTRQSARLSSFNPRAELHGDDPVPAADIKLSVKVCNDILSELHPTLKQSLYAKADQDDVEPGHLPELRYPKMEPIKWTHEFVGYGMTVHYGATEKDNIELTDCQIDKITLDCQDGGTVIMSFRVVTHPEERAAGRLCGMVQKDVEITLTPPEAEAGIA